MSYIEDEDKFSEWMMDNTEMLIHEWYARGCPDSFRIWARRMYDEKDIGSIRA